LFTPKEVNDPDTIIVNLLFPINRSIPKLTGFCFHKGSNTMSENSTVKPNNWTTEAPASWNTKYITPDGFVCQLTLRGENGRDLLEKANAAMAWLRESGYKPCDNFISRNHNCGSKVEEASTKSNGNGNGNGSSNGHAANWCPIHQVEMRKWEKDGKIWFSHKVEGGWCTGKSK
jgi:hypothetical protein